MSPRDLVTEEEHWIHFTAYWTNVEQLHMTWYVLIVLTWILISFYVTVISTLYNMLHFILSYIACTMNIIMTLYSIFSIIYFLYFPVIACPLVFISTQATWLQAHSVRVMRIYHCTAFFLSSCFKEFIFHFEWCVWILQQIDKMCHWLEV